MKILRYTGNANIREFSAADLKKGYGIDTKDITIDTSVTRDVTVSNRLAAKLLESGEFEYRGDADDTEEELTAEAAAREAADAAQAAMDAERQEQDALQAQAKAESGENAAHTIAEVPGAPPTPQAAPASRPRAPRP